MALPVPTETNGYSASAQPMPLEVRPSPRSLPQASRSSGGKNALAWIASVTLFAGAIIGSFAGAGTILRLLFPLGALVVGLFLYFRYPVFFIGYTCWVWFSTPFIRRIADYYRGSFDESSLMLLAPYLVGLITLLTVFRYLPIACRTGDLPFILAMGAVFFGFLVGVINNPMVAVARTFLDWMPPVLFGFHVSMSWRRYPEVRKTLESTFLWTCIVTGSYGVYQYLTAPYWERYWLENVGNISFGNPAPMAIRVWSTMNSPPPYGCVMMAALLLLFVNRSWLRIPAAAAGYLAFLLSLVRAAWAGWLIGLLVLIPSLKPQVQMRVIATIVVMALCVVPLTVVEPFSDVIGDRIESFTNVQNDTSYRARAEIYDQNLGTALSDFIGKGLGSTWVVKENGQVERVALDSGILDTFFTLGWFGGLPYLVAILMLIYAQFHGNETLLDPFVTACRAIAMSFAATLMLGPFMTGLPGLVFWGFLGAGMSARKYYRSTQFRHLRERSP